jgi:hypothetical protein
MIGYGYYFYRRSQTQKAGGDEAYARVRLNKLFQSPEGESVTPAWEAITAPKLSKGQKATEAISAVTFAVGVGGIKYVGRLLWVACTTKNRALIFDKEDAVVQAYDPRRRPRLVDTGKEGAKRTNPKRFGWDAGAIVSLEIPGEEPLEIDIHAAAVPVLVGWSRGEDVSRLTGPVPPPMAIWAKAALRRGRLVSHLDVTIALDALLRHFIRRPKRRAISGLLSARAD